MSQPLPNPFPNLPFTLSTPTTPPVTVERRDIRLTEEERIESLFTYVREWWATYDGQLSTGEQARLVRRSETASAALAALEDAIAQQGWSITHTPPEPPAN